MQPERRRFWRYQVDAGWAWVVCFGSFFAHCVLFGTIQSFGTLFISLLDEFKSGESATAWVGSLGYGFLFVIGPLTACLCEHFGCRVMACAGSVLTTTALLVTSFATNISTMYFTFGVLWGSGGSFLFFSGVSILRFYFNKNLSLANGITMTGAGFGTLIFNVMLQELDSKYGWRGGMRFLSVFAAMTFLSGCAYIPPPVDYSVFERPSLLSRLKMITDPRPWRDRAFPMWVLSLSFILFAYFFPYTYLVKMALTLGIPMSQGSLLLGCLSISAIFGKLLCGRLADLPRVRRLYLTVTAATVLSLSFMCVTAAKTYHGLLAFTIVAGFFDGCFVLTVPLITQDIVGKELMAKAFGTMYGALAFPLTLGPPVLGELYKSTGSFTTVFFVSASFVLIGVSLMFIVMRIRPDLVRKQESAREEVFPSVSIHSASVVDTLSGMFVTEPNLSVSHLDPVEIGSYQRFDGFRRENSRATVVDPVLGRLASRTEVEAVYKQAIDNMSTTEASRHVRSGSDAVSMTDAPIPSHSGSLFSAFMPPSTELKENIDSPSDLQLTLGKRQELPLSSETCSTLVNTDDVNLSNKEELKIPNADETGFQEDEGMLQHDVEQQELFLASDKFSIAASHSIDPQTAVLGKCSAQEDEPVLVTPLDGNFSVPYTRDQRLQMELSDNREIADNIQDSETDVELVKLAPPPEINRKRRAAHDEEDETGLALKPTSHKVFQGIIEKDASGEETFQDSNISSTKEMCSWNREDAVKEETLDVNEVLELVRIPPPPAIPRTGQLVAVESVATDDRTDANLTESNLTSVGHSSLSEIKLDTSQSDFVGDISSSKDVTTTQRKERLHLAVIDQLSLLSERLEAVAARQIEEEELGGEAGDEQDPRPVFSPALQSLPLTPRYSANHSVPLTPVRAWSSSVNTPAPTPLQTPPSTFHTTAPTPIPTPRPASQNVSGVFSVASLTETSSAIHPQDSSDAFDTCNLSPSQEGPSRHRSRCSSFSEAGQEYVLNEWSHLEQRDTEGSIDAFPSKPPSGTNSSISNSVRSLSDLNSVSEPIDVTGSRESERHDGHWNSSMNAFSEQGLEPSLPMCLPQQPLLKPPDTGNPFHQPFLNTNQTELQPSQMDDLAFEVEDTNVWQQKLAVEVGNIREKLDNETQECLPTKTVCLPFNTNDMEESPHKTLPTELIPDTAIKGFKHECADITQSPPKRDTLNGSESQIYLPNDFASDAVADPIKQAQIKLISKESRLNPFVGSDQNKTTETSQQNSFQQCQAYSSAGVPSEPQSLVTSNLVAIPMQQNRLDLIPADPKSNPFIESIQSKTEEVVQDFSQKTSLQQHGVYSSEEDPDDPQITCQIQEEERPISSSYQPTNVVAKQDNVEGREVDSSSWEVQSSSKLDLHQQRGGLPCQYDDTENLVDQQIITQQSRLIKTEVNVPLNPEEFKGSLSEGSSIPLDCAKEETKHTEASQSTWTTFSGSEDTLIFEMDTESESNSESTESESTSSSPEMKHGHQEPLGDIADQNTLFPPLQMFSDLGDSNKEAKRPGVPEKLPPPPKQAQRKRTDILFCANSEQERCNSHHGHLKQERKATQTESIIQERGTAESHSVTSDGDLSATLNSVSDITSDVVSDSKPAEQMHDECSDKLSDNSITDIICHEFDFIEGSGDILTNEGCENSNPDEDLAKASIHDDIAPLLIQNEGPIKYLNLRDLPEDCHVLQKRPSTTSSTDDSSTSGTSTDSSLSETEIVPYSKLHEDSSSSDHG